jgi:Transglutaminase-like superfamily
MMAEVAAPPATSLALLRGFLRMAPGEKLAMLAVWPLLGLSALLIKLLAFKRLAPLLGQQIGPVGCVPVASADQERFARMVKRAVRRAALVSPWRSDCLPQALTGAVLCRVLGLPVTTHLGVRLDGSAPMEAHAWTCCGRVAVTGGYGFSEWVPVSCFAAVPGSIRD